MAGALQSQLTPAIKRTVALCAVLQARAGQQPFFLAANPLADEFGVDAATVARWLRLLVRDGVLVVAAKGRRGKATEYRFIGGQAKPQTSTDTLLDDPGPYGGDRL